MAVLPIITVPDARLKQVSSPVETVDDALRRLLDDMLETMYAAPGIGLAAVQVGVPKRAIVVDISAKDEAPAPLFLINPEIVWTGDESIRCEEGCLSLPDQYAEVERPAEARIRYIDYDGKAQEIYAKGLLSTCIQHEMDHLEGILFIDHLSAIRRNMIVRKLIKARKLEAVG